MSIIYQTIHYIYFTGEKMKIILSDLFDTPFL